ncbi:hypothetical protein QTN25_005290 [Entamoeba marina]
MTNLSNIFVKRRRNAARLEAVFNSEIFSTVVPGFESESSEEASRSLTERMFSESFAPNTLSSKSISDSNFISHCSYGFNSLTISRRDSLVSLSPPSPQSARSKLNVSNLHEKIGGLRRAVGIKTEQIIFDSNTEGFDTRIFNSAISCRSNVMILIITKIGHFGCYCENVIPISSETNSVISSTNNMFLFVASNKSHLQPTLYYRRYNNKESIILPPNNSVDMFF